LRRGPANLSKGTEKTSSAQGPYDGRKKAPGCQKTKPTGSDHSSSIETTGREVKKKQKLRATGGGKV